MAERIRILHMGQVVLPRLGMSSGSKQSYAGSWRIHKTGKSSHQDEVGFWMAGMESGSQRLGPGHGWKKGKPR